MRGTFEGQTRLTNQKGKYRRKWRTVTALLSCIALIGTNYAMILPAAALEQQVYCGYEEHTAHTEECYSYVKICGYGEVTDKTGGFVPICGREEAPEYELSCTLAEHTHNESCYTYEQQLVCQQSEHAHNELCYDESGEITCTAAEHTHSDECYKSMPVLTCTLGEHTHSELCYHATENGHTHSDACCHVHTQECFEKQLVCTKPIHQHFAACYSNSSYVESRESWEQTMAGAQLTGVWADDLVSIAHSQLGYTESSGNYETDSNGGTRGYTRYGDWYGDRYGDWCAMFVSFCMYYAGIDSTFFPYEENCASWVSKLTALNMYAQNGSCIAKKGDIIFYDSDHDMTAEHVGIVAAVDYESGRIAVIEGNLNNRVELHELLLNDASILGYGILPENPYLAQSNSDDEVTGSDENDDAAADNAEDAQDDGDDPEDTGEEENTDAENNTEITDTNEEDAALSVPTGENQQSKGEKLLSAAVSLIGATEGLNAESLTGDIKAMFVASCVNIAELGDTVPCCDSCAVWADGLDRYGRLVAPGSGYVPAKGDLVFYDSDMDSAADNIGITADADAASGELVTVESDDMAQVDYCFRKQSDETIVGYYSIEGYTAAAGAEEEEKAFEESVISAVSEDGATVTISGKLPENAQIQLIPVSEEILDQILAAVGADTPVFAYDITIVDGSGNEWQPDELGVAVSISGLEIPKNTETEVVHIPDEGSIEQIEAETAGDTVEFVAEGFSVYVVYAVNFNYGDLNYEIQENGSILLSRLLTQLDITDKTAAEATSVTSSNENYFIAEKTEEEDDWTITSLAYFETEETLTVSFASGNIEIKVTDARSITATTTGTTTVNVIFNWSDGQAPNGTDVTATLYKENKSTDKSLTLNSGNNWMGSFKELEAGDYSVNFRLSGYDYVVNSEEVHTDWTKSTTLESGKKYLISFNGNSVMEMNSGSALAVSKITVSDTAGVSGVTDGMKWEYTGTALRNASTASGNYLRIGRELTLKADSNECNVLYQGGKLHNNYTDWYFASDGTKCSTVNTADNAVPVTLYSDTPAEIVNINVTAVKKTFNPAEVTSSKLTHTKKIDYLGDGATNPDTTLSGDDYYRLYLDVSGQIQPIDLLIVVDGSTSMSKTDVDAMRRDKAITNFLTGDKRSSDINKRGFLEYFLNLNNQNQVSVVQFFGKGLGGYISNYNINDPDASVLCGWKSKATFVSEGKEIGVDCSIRSDTNGTNYEAGLRLATSQFSKVSGNGHKKMMIFMSDGVPTLFLIDQSDIDSNFTFVENAPTQADVGKRWGTGSYGDAKNYKCCTEPSKLAFREFIDSNPGITVYSIGVSKSISVTSEDDSTSPEVLQYMAQLGGGEFWSVSESMSEIQSKLNALFLADSLSITDSLSKYVRYYEAQPDLLVTMQSGTDTSTKKTLYSTKTTPSGITADGSGKVQSVTYTPGDTSDNPTSSTGTVTAQFYETYDLESKYTYTLSFNVKATNTAYTEYDASGYNAAGDAGTDYTGNSTSSGKEGFYSNAAAVVQYRITNDMQTESYIRPVIQADRYVNLKVTNTVERVSVTTDFPYEVTVTDGTGTGVDLTGKTLPTGVTLKTGTTNVLVFDLKHGESVEINGIIPKDSKVTITEKPHDGYTVKMKPGTADPESGDSKEYTLSEDLTVTVINTPGVKLPNTGSLRVLGMDILGLSLIACACEVYLRRRREEY